MKSYTRTIMAIICLFAVIGFLFPSGAWAVKEIKIGVIYPLTGGAAAAGRELRAGAELAAKLIQRAAVISTWLGILSNI